MRVGELLDRRDLRLLQLVPGDLERQIRWVHTLELVDATPYLRGGEVVLTTGAWFSGPESVERFLGGLARVGIAALGFGVHADLPEVPGELVNAARHHGICLFVVPADIPFIVVTEAFVEASMDSRERPLRESAARNAELVRSLQGGQGMPALLLSLIHI